MSVKQIQIKALNAETGQFQVQILTLETGIQGYCLIGRHPSCDLVLDSSEVSRIHGRIWYQEEQCFFADLGSTDGSQIDNEDVEINRNYVLKPDNLLRIGGFVLKIAQMSPDESSQERVGQNRSWSGGEITVRCIKAITETDDVKTFCFVAEPPVQFDYKPGQFVTLDLEIEGKRVMRSYSLSSTPSRPHTLEITVKRVPSSTDTPAAPPGLVSNWLHDNIIIGSRIKLKGPMGEFTCVDNPSQKLLFISAGSGITPMISMLRWLCDTGADVDLIFVYSARTPHDLIFQHELELIAARHPNFKLAITITRREPGRAWLGYSGRLNKSMLQAIAPDVQERSVYVCGPAPFLEAVKTILKTLSFSLDNYYEESFGSHKQKPPVEAKEKNTSIKTTDDASSIVVLAKSGKEIACTEEDLILEVVEQAGIELPSGCRRGVCGTCKLPLLQGEINYDDNPECEPGQLLPCIAKPVGRVVIEA